MASSGMLRRVALVRTDVSEERSASFIRVTRIGALGTTLAVISRRRTLRRTTDKIIVLYILMFKFFEIRREDRMFRTLYNGYFLFQFSV
jgi:hypothetical protein